MPAILSSRQRIALRLAWRFMAPYRWRMLGALVALLFTAAITLSLGQGIRLLVDQGFLTASPELLNRYILLFFVLVLGLAVAPSCASTWCPGSASASSPISVSACSTT